MNYIATYFYQENIDKGSIYGNIDKNLSDRNLIYWKTVYCLFYTSIINNPNAHHVLFTNVDDFPYRNELEKLGVIIFDDLQLSNRNQGKWATVKFFFDVIDFVCDTEFFKYDDKIMLLDTDCIAINSSDNMFERINSVTPIAAYLNGVEANKSSVFHGETLKNLEDIYFESLGLRINIGNKIGGEYFLFLKSGIADFRNKYKCLLNSNSASKLITEEQILTMISSETPFCIEHKGIYRIWTTLGYRTIPLDYNNYSFLHLPSEKEYSLSILFNECFNAPLLSQVDLKKLVNKITKLNNEPFLMIKRAVRVISNKIFNQ
ncbi:hypothetical protein [Vibrio breoganii]|uniref:hypothetical protein n=1 Tax=Vibrio breoganii TaxID=553239 RepID=UPI000C82D430|nr:hypothetical protein [Vibrio breoganii]PMO27682.1 hypothetical protein BCT13_16945 [Vibrio breoganii]